MAEFENQTSLRLQIIEALAPIIPELEKWRNVWPRVADTQKIAWLIDGKSLFLSTAAGIYIYLRPFFKSLDNEIDRGDINLNLQDFTLRGPNDN